MQIIKSTLSFLGRYGTEGFVAALLLGIALPQFAEQARPLLAVSIFCFMTITFMRADLTVIARMMRQPMAPLLTIAWLVAVPLALTTGVISLLGRDTMDQGLLLGIAIMGAAPPIMSAPAIAIIFGFEPSLIIVGVLAVTALSPLIAPILVDFIAGQAVPLDPWVLSLRLLIFVGGGFLVATGLRRWLGVPRIAELKSELDGFGVVMYFIFAVAAMDGVQEAALNQPGQVLLFTAVALAISVAGFALTMVGLQPVAAGQRFILGYATGQRNMGLLIAALGAGVPKTAFLYFALAQVPIYVMPWIMKPWALRLSRADRFESTE